MRTASLPPPGRADAATLPRRPAPAPRRTCRPRRGRQSARPWPGGQAGGRRGGGQSSAEYLVVLAATAIALLVATGGARAVADALSALRRALLFAVALP